MLVSASLVANDPKALLANGQINRLHVNPSLYVEFGAVSVVLALVMLASAWFRKRLYLGIAMALYGLSLFNLHYWGFGVPFILAGAWFLVRAYRLQQAEGPRPRAAGYRRRAGAQPTSATRPPAGPPGRSAKAETGRGAAAG